MKLNRYKLAYKIFLMLIVGYYAYSMYVGKLLYEFSTQSQWGNNNSRGNSGINRFYHK